MDRETARRIMLKLAEDPSEDPIGHFASNLALAGSAIEDPKYDVAGEHVVGPKYQLKPVEDRAAIFSENMDGTNSEKIRAALSNVNMQDFSNRVNRAAANLGPKAQAGTWELWDHISPMYTDPSAVESIKAPVVEPNEPEYVFPEEDPAMPDSEDVPTTPATTNTVNATSAPAATNTVDMTSMPKTDDDWNTFLDAISGVESGGRDDVSITDVNGKKSVGGLQIQQPYLTDSGLNYTLDDMKDRAKAREVARAYLQRYGTAYTNRTGKPATYEVLTRIHNGGPKGAERAATLPYLEKVRSRLAPTR